MKRPCFRWFWRAQFHSAAWNGREPTLVHILGWRTCRWDRAGGQRETVEFCPRWLPWA